MFVNENGKKFLNLPEQVLQNQTDIETNKTNITSLQSSKQDTATAVNDDNLKEKVEALASVDLTDVSVTSLTNIGNTTNTGTLDQEGPATFGGDVEVDGTITLNSPESVTFKTGSLDFSNLTNFINDFMGYWLVSRYANGWMYLGDEEGGRILGDDMAVLNKYKTSGYIECSNCLRSCSLDVGVTSPYYSFRMADFPTNLFVNKCQKMLCDFPANIDTDAHPVTLTFGDWYGSFAEIMYDGHIYSHHIARIKVAEGKSCRATNMYFAFFNCQELVEVSGLDLSACSDFTGTFNLCTNLATFDCTGVNRNLDLSWSTAFTRESMLVVINNLATVTTARTLTINSDVLAELTEDDVLIATGKGWTIAGASHS